MKSNNTLVAVILFAAIAVSASLIFVGLSQGECCDDEVLSAKISEGIEDYIENAQQKAQEEAAAAQAAQVKAAEKVEGDFTDDDAVLGDKDAPVTIVEFSDYQCPYCKRFSLDTLPSIKENYIDTGKVKLVFRDYPLGFHQGAMPAAIATECAREQGDDGTFYEFHDMIWESDTVFTGTVDDIRENLISMAGEMGLNEGDFRECLESEKYKDEALADMADGQAVGVSGTPGFLVNGTPVKGAQPYSVFEQIIENELSSQ